MIDRKDQYAKSVCQFLAEQLRVRKIGLERAAEIAQKVVDNINLMDTEADFLKFVKILAADADELVHLQERVNMHLHASSRKELENTVREFVEQILPQDNQQAAAILKQSAVENMQLEDLCREFPKFREFIQTQDRWKNQLTRL